jgi:phosphoribosyl-AMP cyclohydrolase
MTDVIEEALAQIRFGPDGLVTSVAQQFDTGEVLMVAWMNREAVRLTLAEGRVCYWSRSRRALWRKGETSGQIQHLREMRLDCDGDTVLLLVDQTGVACHTGRRSCFYRAWRGDSAAGRHATAAGRHATEGHATGGEAGWTTIADPEIPPEQLYPAAATPR